MVYALAESPIAPGMLWAATDDGRLWLTRDGGAKWTDLTANLPGVLKEQWLTQVEPSAHDKEGGLPGGRRVPRRHRRPARLPHRRRRGDLEDVAGDLPKHGPVRVLREDPKNPAVLYAGTEYGPFVSLDHGAHWTKLGGLPPVSSTTSSSRRGSMTS